MKTIIFIFALISSNVFAGPVDRAIRTIQKNDVRTTRHVVAATEDDGPCVSPGDTVVEIQVKMATRQESNGTVSLDHAWETVKTVVVNPKGEVMEQCLE